MLYQLSRVVTYFVQRLRWQRRWRAVKYWISCRIVPNKTFRDLMAFDPCSFILQLIKGKAFCLPCAPCKLRNWQCSQNSQKTKGAHLQQEWYLSRMCFVRFTSTVKMSQLAKIEVLSVGNWVRGELCSQQHTVTALCSSALQNDSWETPLSHPPVFHWNNLIY